LAVGAPHRKLKAIVDEITRAEGVALGMLHSEHAFALMKEARYARMPNPLPQPASSYIAIHWRMAIRSCFYFTPRARDGAHNSSPPASSRAPNLLIMIVYLTVALVIRAVELSPEAVETLAMRASLHYEKQQLPKAYEDFEKAMKVNKSHPDLFCHRGQFHLLQNQFSQASLSRLYTSDLREAVRLDPDSLLAHVHLGMALHRNNQQSAAIAEFEN
ncbi:MAG: hypothetical protein SGPRY_007939, partial [Prymnesium sp.]